MLRLQSLDGRATELTKEIATLPKHIAETEKKLHGGERKLEADRAALAANQRDRKKMDSDIQINEQKISKLKDQMLSAKNNEQYKAFQHEIEFCQAEIGKCEDRILELMAASEPLDKNVKTAELSLKQEKQQVEAEKAITREKTAKDQLLLKEIEEDRMGVVVLMTKSVLTNYERLRKSRGGVALAEALDGRCSKCHISFRPQFMQELKKGDKIMICESCNRMLYYNKPVSVEELTASV